MVQKIHLKFNETERWETYPTTFQFPNTRQSFLGNTNFHLYRMFQNQTDRKNITYDSFVGCNHEVAPILNLKIYQTYTFVTFDHFIKIRQGKSHNPTGGVFELFYEARFASGVFVQS